MLFLLFPLLMTALLIGCASTPKQTAWFEIQGHRGARWVRPENTLSAFRYALENGADTLEMDLFATRDDVLVVTHDPYLNPDICIGADGQALRKPILVRSLTLRELKTYDCGSRVNPRFPQQIVQPGERIPTFEEVLVWLKSTRKVSINVETKSEQGHPDHTPEPKLFTKMVIAAVKKHGFLDRTTLQSFDFRTLIEGRKLEPQLRISALLEHRPSEPLTAIAERLRCNVISPDYRWLTREDVVSLHKIGVSVIPWTVNDENSWRRLVSWGIDGIITDNPKPLAELRSRL